jgi:hypothetical protein
LKGEEGFYTVESFLESNGITGFIEAFLGLPKEGFILIKFYNKLLTNQLNRCPLIIRKLSVKEQGLRKPKS